MSFEPRRRPQALHLPPIDAIPGPPRGSSIIIIITTTVPLLSLSLLLLLLLLLVVVNRWAMPGIGMRRQFGVPHRPRTRVRHDVVSCNLRFLIIVFLLRDRITQLLGGQLRKVIGSQVLTTLVCATVRPSLSSAFPPLGFLNLF